MRKQPVGFATKGHGRKRKVYPIYRGYKGMPRGGGMQVSSVVEAQQLRTPMARKIDAKNKAPLAKTKEQWLSEPNRYDIKGLDTPQTKKKEKRERKPRYDVTDKLEKQNIKVEHMTKEETKMTYIERAHLLALAKKYDIDRAEIDHKLSYEENKDYLTQIAKSNSYTQQDTDIAEKQAQQWTGAYKDFLGEVEQDSDKWRDYF